MTFDDLVITNGKINAFPYSSEADDDWMPIDVQGEGDCDSYATAKLYRLVHVYGWPEKALRLAVCSIDPRNTDGDHLVLLADFDGTTYVLCNNLPHPTEHSLVRYKWRKFWNHDLNAWEYA